MSYETVVILTVPDEISPDQIAEEIFDSTLRIMTETGLIQGWRMAEED